MSYDITNIENAHPEWNNHINRWRFLSDSYQGGQAFKDGEYLTKYVLETNGEYQQRINSTPLDNLCKNICHTYTSFIYGQTIKRDFAGLNEQDVRLFLKDADLEGRSFTNMMREISIYSSVYGHVWCVVDKPSTPVNTLAEQQAAGIRPYVSMFSPENVLDWKYTRMPNGVYQLDMLRIIEDSYGDTQIQKIYYRDRIDTVQVSNISSNPTSKPSEKDDVVLLQSVVNPLGMIPAFPVYSARSPIRAIGISDVNDIADQQLGIANELSEIEQTIRINGHPSLVKVASTEATAGAGAIIQMDDNTDPGLKPYLLQPTAESLEGILSSIKMKVAACERMAHLETARGTRTAMSGVAMLVESRMLSQRLSEKSSNLEHAEEQLWGLFGRWQDTQWLGEVEYPTSFDQRDTAVTLQNIKTAKESNPTNPKLIKAIDRLIAEVLIEDDAERAEVLEAEMEHPVTTPANRTEHIQSMIMEGYTDEQMLALHPEITQEDIQVAKQALVDQDN